MSRPIQLYTNSTRLCIALDLRGVPLSMTGLSVVLTRVGHGCAPSNCRPCDKNVFACDEPSDEEEIEEEIPNSVTLPLVEQRPDGSLCALITTELLPLEPGRYTATITGNAACKQCLQVDLLDGCATASGYSETPDGCATCDITSPAPSPAPAPGPAPYTLESDRPLWTH